MMAGHNDSQHADPLSETAGQRTSLCAEERIRNLTDLTRNLSSTLNLQELMPLVVHEVLRALDMERGVLLLDKGFGELETVVACTRDNGTLTQSDLRETNEVVKELKKSRRPVMTLSWDTRGPDIDSSFYGQGSVVGVPLLDQKRFLGAICLKSKSKRVNFEGENLAYIEAVSAICALSLSNGRSHARMLEAARMSADFGSLLDIKEVLNRTLARVVEITHAEQGFLLIRDDESEPLKVWGEMDRQGSPLQGNHERFISNKVVSRVLQSAEAMLSDNVAQEESFDNTESVLQFGLTSILCVPICSKNSTFGVIYLENRFQEGVFEDEDLRLVQLIADRAGQALENAKLYGQEREIVRALANAVEARDLGTSCHVQRVSEYAVAVGSRLGLSPVELNQLEQAAMLHDVGKIGIPDKVLLNPGALNDKEWEMMRSHPELGLGIVNPVRLPKSVKHGILCHQEAYDGSGYPKGLKGEQIPIFARIIAVVDAYDAMVADRPYRRALPRQEAIDELDRCAGTKFDPEVVIAFFEVLFKEPGK